MFKIYDGREYFYQWDVDRKLILEDDSIKEVHFCNKTDECSLVCEVYDFEGKRAVNVPNILLQNNWDINVYAYCGAAYTKVDARFKVKARSKPADYVYTETETITIARIEEMIAGIEEDVGNFALQYIEEHKDVLQGPAGKDGYTPIKGVDYFDGIDGKDGRNGKDGKDGYTPIKGVDYFDGKNGVDGKNGKDGYTPIKGVDYFDGQNGRDGKDGKDGASGIYLGASQPTDPEVRVWIDPEGEPTEELATKAYVNEAIANIDVSTDVDLTNYYTKAQVDGAIQSIELTPGPKGEPGYTPVKGVDYFDGAPGKDGADYVLTAADKSEIANLVIFLLPDGEGVGY